MGNSDSTLKGIYDKEGEDAFIKAVWDAIIKPEDYEILRSKNFDYDCLALEGGGVKGVAYAGAMKVLEDIGVLKKIKRFAGTSAGAYMAMQLAIGMSVDEIFKINGIPNLQDSYYDSGTWALPMNILKNYGWQSGDKLHSKIEEDLERFLGDKNATFQDLYLKRGVELCIVVTNLNSRLVEYAHPKTMPTLKIAAAVRTSMSLPILFAPTAVTDHSGFHRFFVDGGLLENYPISVFDGWYLSMKKEDDFINKISSPPSTMFEGYNDKVLGMVVFSHGESQSHAEEFLERYGENILEGRPDSKLSKKREYTREWETLKKKREAENAARELVQYVADNFKGLADEKGLFDFADFKKIMQTIEKDPVMSKRLALVTQGKNLRPLWESFQEMDINKDNKLSLVELLMQLTKHGIYLRYDLDSRHPREIEDLTSYIFSIIEVMQCYISELTEKKLDPQRTVGIYTDYIMTTDFDMSLEDKAYMCKMGYTACVNFLKNVKPKSDVKPKSKK